MTLVETILPRALDKLEAPGPLNIALAFACQQAGLPTVTQKDVLEHIKRNGTHGKVALAWHKRIMRWDFEDGRWTEDTERNTTRRRELLMSELELDHEMREITRNLFPVAEVAEPDVIGLNGTDWMAGTPLPGRPDLWKSYIGRLRNKKWEERSLEEISTSVDAIMSRLPDPRNSEATQVKGLVMGYVQSGKTASFTGLIAKALDSGYKLFIVLSGLNDDLRNQTQIRLDADLFGIRHDPNADPESQGLTRTKVGGIPVSCLTDQRADYSTTPLSLWKPLAGNYFDPENLAVADANFLVVKKNDRVLKKLIKSLKRLLKTDAAPRFEQVSALMIDDESDLASMNTIAGKDRITGALVEQETKRSAANKAIVEILKMLPRCQYVAYTATPNANVLQDMNDKDGLFPRDFIVGLTRPADYMGAADFYDFGQDGTRTNELNHVRKMDSRTDDEDGFLMKAIDCLVLTGAVKLFRRQHGQNVDFKHHTMLVHSSIERGKHVQEKARIMEVFAQAGYETDHGAFARLKRMWDTDIVPAMVRMNFGYDCPSTFDELHPFIDQCVRRLTEGGEPVAVVNMDNNPLYFDNGPVWKIIVGGSKLSRGFTVEGLTVTFYRRAARAEDTLMQTARWCGFRPGYRDLVRLYISTSARMGKKDVDLYEEFRAAIQTETSLREQLPKYAGPNSSTEEFASIVVNSFSLNITPTARNKMHSARRIDGVSDQNAYESSPIARDAIGAQANMDALDKLLASSPSFRNVELALRKVSDGKIETRNAWISTAGHDSVVNFFAEIKWDSGETTVSHHLARLKNGNPQNRWLIIFPLGKYPNNNFIHNGMELTRFLRNPTRTNTVTEPALKKYADYLAGDGDSSASEGVLHEERHPGQGVLELWPSYENKGDKRKFLNFRILFPRDSQAAPKRAYTSDPRVGIQQ